MALKQQRIIAVDIGTDSVQMVSSNGKGQIVQANSVKIPEGVISGMKVIVPEKMAEVLKKAKKKGRHAGNQCVLCLGGTEVFIRNVVLPYMNDDQIYQNVVKEIATYLPVDVSNYIVDYSARLTTTMEGVQQVMAMVVAVPKEIVTSYIDIFKSAGLKIERIDILENAYEKLIRAMIPADDERTRNFAVLDVGAEVTSIATYSTGHYFINKVIPTGGKMLTQSIAEAMNTDFMSAEKMKRISTSLLNPEDDPIMAQLIRDHYDQIIFDATRVFGYYLSRNNQVGISHIYLCGGASQMTGFAEYFENSLHVETEYLSDVIAEMFRPELKGLANFGMFASAAGATFREVN